MNEGEKERKEGGDKKIRINVYGEKKKKQRERAGEKKERMRVLDDLLECVWRKRKRRGGDRDNVCGGGDRIGKKKKKTKTKTYGCNEKNEKRNNIKNKKS